MTPVSTPVAGRVVCPATVPRSLYEVLAQRAFGVQLEPKGKGSAYRKKKNGAGPPHSREWVSASMCQGEGEREIPQTAAGSRVDAYAALARILETLWSLLSGEYTATSQNPMAAQKGQTRRMKGGDGSVDGRALALCLLFLSPGGTVDTKVQESMKWWACQKQEKYEKEGGEGKDEKEEEEKGDDTEVGGTESGHWGALLEDDVASHDRAADGAAADLGDEDVGGWGELTRDEELYSLGLDLAVAGRDGAERRRRGRGSGRGSGRERIRHRGGGSARAERPSPGTFARHPGQASAGQIAKSDLYDYFLTLYILLASVSPVVAEGDMRAHTAEPASTSALLSFAPHVGYAAMETLSHFIEAGSRNRDARESLPASASSASLPNSAWSSSSEFVSLERMLAVAAQRDDLVFWLLAFGSDWDETPNGGETRELVPHGEEGARVDRASWKPALTIAGAWSAGGQVVAGRDASAEGAEEEDAPRVRVHVDMNGASSEDGKRLRRIFNHRPIDVREERARNADKAGK